MDEEVIKRDERDGEVDGDVEMAAPLVTPEDAPSAAGWNRREVEIVVSSRLAGVVLTVMVIFIALVAGVLLGLYTRGPQDVEQPAGLAVPRPVASPVVGPGSYSLAGVRVELGQVRVGEPAPDFTLKDLDGKDVRLSDFRGKAVLVNFWATWCPPCRFEMPALQRIYDRHKQHDFVVLGVDTGERTRGEAMRIAARNYADSLRLSFPIILDDGDQVANLYGLRAYPTTYFVDREGKLSDVRRGAFINEKDIERYLAKILPEGSIQ